MGRNDIGKLVNLLFLFCVIPTMLIFGQVKKNSENNTFPPAYTIKGALRTKIYYNYIVTDTTKVTRVFTDSSVLKYQRIIKYFITIIQPDFPENGFTKVDVSVDSIHYSFSDGIENYEFTTIEKASSKVLGFEDFKAYSIPMSRQFSLIFSPYGEVAKVEGEQLTSDRNYISEISTKTNDSILIHNWSDWLSDFALQHIGNVFKILYPQVPVYRDSIWITTLDIRIENLNLTDTLEAKVTGFWNNLYTIEGKIKGFYLHPKPIKYFKVNNLSLETELTKLESSFTQNLTTTGVVKYTDIFTNLSQIVLEKKEIFRQEIYNHYNCELINQYTFR